MGLEIRLQAAGLLAVVALCQGGALAQEATISKADLRLCGVYSNELKEREADAASASGKRRIVGENRLVQETRNIPARMGVSFGCQIVLRGAPAGSIGKFLAVLHLPPGAPRKELRGSQGYPIGEEGGYVGYTFRSEANLVPGTWRLEIRVGETKLADATFTITK